MSQSIQWSPRVSRDKIQRLYELNARGIIDEELLEDVGLAFMCRCQDILEVLQAAAGSVRCRECGTLIARTSCRKDEVLSCACGWQITWGEYFDSYHKKQLTAGGAVEVFRCYVMRWPNARTPQDKMRLVDWLVHEFHVVRGADTRTTVANVIAGRTQELIAFLDELAYGDQSMPDTLAMRQQWRTRLDTIPWFKDCRKKDAAT